MHLSAPYQYAYAGQGREGLGALQRCQSKFNCDLDLVQSAFAAA